MSVHQSIADRIRMEMRAVQDRANLMERLSIAGNLHLDLREIATRLRHIADDIDTKEA